MDKAQRDAKEWEAAQARGLEEEYLHFAITRYLRLFVEKREVYLGRPVEEEELPRVLGEEEEEHCRVLERLYCTSGGSCWE